MCFIKIRDVFSVDSGLRHNTGTVCFWMPESHHFDAVYQEI